MGSVPLSFDREWYVWFSPEQHKQLKDRVANLIPLSAEMNRSLSNKPYSAKQPRCRDDSMFKSTRTFANKYTEWTPATLQERAADMATWAAKRWAF